jgi:HK97 family phage major capsid protein
MEFHMSIQALREQRGAIAHALQDLVKKEGEFTAEDQAVYDNAMKDIDTIDAKISRINAMNEKIAADTRTNDVAELSAKKGHDQKDTGLSIYAKWLKGGDRALNENDWATIRNTMSTTTNSEGGFTVDSVVAARVIDALKEFGGMRQVSTVISTSGHGLLSFPTSDGTAEVGEIIAENTTATDLDPSFGTVSLPVYKFSSKVATVPFELLQDSSVDIEAFVQDRLNTRLGRITNQMFTTGTGSSQPNGIATAATIGLTAANSTSQVTAVTFDSLIATQHSLDPAYRRSAGWMFADATLRVIRQLKDGQNRPIFIPGYENNVPGGMPDTLLGAPVYINQDVAAMAASAKSILFGDFSGYYIRDVMQVEMFRFTDSAFTKKGQVGFLAWMRSGGNLVDVGKVRAFRNAAS